MQVVFKRNVIWTKNRSSSSARFEANTKVILKAEADDTISI